MNNAVETAITFPTDGGRRLRIGDAILVNDNGTLRQCRVDAVTLDTFNNPYPSGLAVATGGYTYTDENGVPQFFIAQNVQFDTDTPSDPVNLATNRWMFDPKYPLPPSF